MFILILNYHKILLFAVEPLDRSSRKRHAKEAIRSTKKLSLPKPPAPPAVKETARIMSPISEVVPQSPDPSDSTLLSSRGTLSLSSQSGTDRVEDGLAQKQPKRVRLNVGEPNEEILVTPSTSRGKMEDEIHKFGKNQKLKMTMNWIVKKYLTIMQKIKG